MIKKKVMSLLLVLTCFVAGISGNKVNVQAAGWMNYVQNGTLNAWMSGVRSEGDYIDYVGFTKSYADIYKVNIPASGMITIKTNGTDPEDGLTSYSEIRVYNANLNSIYEKWFYYANYNSAYDFFYDSLAVSTGTYYVEIYGGSKEYQLCIDYKPTVTQTQINNIKSKRKALTISWTGCSGISGFQLQYSSKKSMKGGKTLTLSSNSRSKKIKGLKRRKKYYIRIRAYKVISGKIYYSNWSAKKSKKTK